jgi:broad specificity phosphatase PhoE
VNESGVREIVLLRHADSAAPAGVAGGQTDWPLTPAGRVTAAHLAADWRGPPPARVIASDLARAIATAEPLAARFGIAVEHDPDWREVGLGAWEGRAWAEIERHDGARLAAWYADWRRLAPPGGEAWPDVIARVRRAWQRLVSAPGTAGPIVVVSHVGAIRAWLEACAGLDADRATAWPLPTLGGVKIRHPGSHPAGLPAIAALEPAVPVGAARP